jgi:hypothetical protein
MPCAVMLLGLSQNDTPRMIPMSPALPNCVVPLKRSAWPMRPKVGAGVLKRDHSLPEKDEERVTLVVNPAPTPPYHQKPNNNAVTSTIVKKIVREKYAIHYSVTSPSNTSISSSSATTSDSTTTSSSACSSSTTSSGVVSSTCSSSVSSTALSSSAGASSPSVA